MWLKRLVGVVMIITCIGMNGLVLVGFFSPEKTSSAGLSQVAATPPTPPPAPSLTISAKPDSISAGNFSALSWTANNSTGCTASDAWGGAKTANGAESTGRITRPGDYNYTLTCTNATGQTAKASVVVAVGSASAPAPPPPKSNNGGSSSSVSAPTYCSGSVPCYGPKEVASHSGSGNCWGWNGDRVINISGLDAGFHAAKSGVGSIEIGQVCGKDLAPSLNGSVSTGGQTRNHNPTTKSNADRNEIPYFVGYFDNNKP